MTTNAAPKPPLCRAYTLKASKIPEYFKIILDNPVPDVFDTAFLAKSGFRYAIDRTYIDILKGLGFLTDAGRPTRRYADFHDRRQAGALLRQGMAEAYAGLLAALPEAAACPERQITEVVTRHFEGEINEMAASGIAATFLALTRYAAGLGNGAAAGDSAVFVAAQGPILAERPVSLSPPAAAVPSAPWPDVAPDAVPEPVAAASSAPAAPSVAAPEPILAPVGVPEPVAAASSAPAAPPVAAPEPILAPVGVPEPVAAASPAPAAPSVAAPEPILAPVAAAQAESAPPQAAPAPEPAVAIDAGPASQPTAPLAPAAAPIPATATAEATAPEATTTAAPEGQSTLAPMPAEPATAATPSANHAETAPGAAPLAEAEEAPTSTAAAPEPAPAPSPEAADAGPAVSPAYSPEAADNADGAPGIVIEAVSPAARDQGAPKLPAIHITLPASTDEAVYDAIFASLKRHLLSPGDNV
jgi:hypothetical protein